MASKVIKIKKKTMKTVMFFSVFFVVMTVIFFGFLSILKTLYPISYADFVENNASENNLQKSFVYAVIKCESGYDERAVSYADARGLMQLTPETFRWLQSKKGEKLSEEMLFDPETNIRYGCYFYGTLFEIYDDEATAIAAYHAGMGNVSKWLKDERYSKDGKTLYDIPFKNTKKYVNRVIETKKIYSILYNGKED
ncbi:MAG: lytic transglycosylase domain-containing protein [Clostridia bacterium]|nr:lytic transglycosylase domain-containing protein [Clostridia bacterium]